MKRLCFAQAELRADEIYSYHRETCHHLALKVTSEYYSLQGVCQGRDRDVVHMYGSGAVGYDCLSLLN